MIRPRRIAVVDLQGVGDPMSYAHLTTYRTIPGTVGYQLPAEPKQTPSLPAFDWNAAAPWIAAATGVITLLLVIGKENR